MKTIKEKFLTYLKNGKFNFYVEKNTICLASGLTIEKSFFRYKDEFHINFNDLDNNLNFLSEEINKKYLEFINDKKDILRNFKNKILKQKLEKKLNEKNVKNKIVKI